MAEPKLRVAVTVEQCWHAVPGGTAVAALEPLRAGAAVGALDLVGVSARHQSAPPDPWVPPVPVRMLPLPRQALYEAWHRLRWPRTTAATGPVDVIHATGMAVPPREVPLVATVHDLAFLHDPTTATRRGLRFFREAVRLARRDADLVVVPSMATFGDCVAAGFDPGRLRLVPWGIDQVPVDPEQVAAARAELGLDGPFVLWVGTVEPRKNLPVLLAAWERLTTVGAVGGEVSLVLAGPPGWGDQLGHRISSMGPSVRSIGFLEPELLRALYAACSAFCYPSTREGFGLPVLEAMAQGAPVVTSSGTATAEVAGDAGLLVDPADPEEVADALLQILEDEPAATELGARARDRAATMSWTETAGRLEAVYREAAGLEARPGTAVGPR